MQQRIGKYEIVERIAAGGMATVYRARDTQLGRIVAIKVMHAHLADDADFVERFMREARTAASLSHPNVAMIFEVGQEGATHFIAMEFVPSSLDALLRERGKLPWAEAQPLVLQVADALRAAFRRGIVHRDLKPANILLSEDGLPKVADFGIARAAEFGTMTATGLVMGTPQYMSPEQAQGERVDIRSDLYALGVILFQMLTGHTPLEDNTPQEVMRHHLREQDTPMEALAEAGVPAEASEIVAALLARRVLDRVADPQTLIDLLDAAAPRPFSAPTPAVTPPPVPAPPAEPAPAATPPVAPAPTPTPAPPPTPLTPEPAPAAGPEPQPPPMQITRDALASMGQRVGSFLVDGIVQSIGLQLVNWIMFRRGRTIGLKTAGARILRENGDLSGFFHTSVRGAAAVVSAIPLGLGYWWAFWDPWRQTWHDKLLHTYVVRDTEELAHRKGSNSRAAVVWFWVLVVTPLLVVGVLIPAVSGARDSLTPPPSPTDDHGDSISTATAIFTNRSYGGVIDPLGDSDYFAFQAQAGTSYVIETSSGSLADTVLDLYNPSGFPIASDDDGGSGDASRITWNAPSSGTYYAAVRAFDDGTTGTYELSVQAFSPPFVPPTSTVTPTPTPTPTFTLVPPVAAPAYGGSLSLALTSDPAPTGWHPYARSGPSIRVAALTLTHNRLLRYSYGPNHDTHDFTVQPDLAESWEVSSDGLEWVFRIRKGVRFHDGSELTAQDVVSSLRAALDARWALPGPLRNDVARIVLLDDYTVLVTLNRPVAGLDHMLALPTVPILQATVVEARDERLTTPPPGTGPFMLEDARPGDRFTFVRNPDYFRQGQPYLDAVNLDVIPEPSGRLEAFMAGEIDIAGEGALSLLLVDNSAELRARSADYHVEEWYRLAPWGLWFDLDEPPFDDLRVRQAVALAIDKEAILELLYDGRGSLQGPIPEALFGELEITADRLRSNQYNPEEAKRLLAEAGYPGGLKTMLLFSSSLLGYGAGGEILELVGVFLDRVGIEVEMQVLEGLPFREALRRSEAIGMHLYPIVSTSYHLPTFLGGRYGSAASIFYARVQDEEWDRIKETASSNLYTPEEKRTLGADLQRWLDQRTWVVPMPAPLTVTAWWPRVQGFFPHAGLDLGPIVEGVWLDETAVETVRTPTSTSSTTNARETVAIPLGELNGSGQSGSATLTARGVMTEVVLNLSSGAISTELVHVHAGQCGDTLGGVAYALTNFVGGSGVSVTMVDASIDSLRTGDFAINAHSKNDPLGVYTACGNIPSM